MRRMPGTGSLLVFGSVAIAGMPPLNGFVSEWLVYLGLMEQAQAATGATSALLLLDAYATHIEKIEQTIPPAIAISPKIPADDHGSTLPYCCITTSIHGRQTG